MTVSATAATPTPTPTPTSLAGFPLAQGLDGGADSTVTGPSRAAPGIDLEQVCALRIWTGQAQVHVAVQQVAPESAVTRELAVFVSPKAARAVVKRIRTAVSLCHRQPGNPATALHFRLLDTLAGPADHDATAFAGTLPGNRPGGAVLLFVRVGRAVLGVEDGGEWTLESIGPGVRHLVHADRDVVAAMCVFTRAGC